MSERITRINELMRHEIANLVQKDFEFPNALVTVNAVEITPDLREGVVHIGVIGEHPERAIEQLEAGRADIQHQVSRRVKLRLTPKLRFRLDRSAERATDILSVLDELAQEDKGDQPGDPKSSD